MMKKNKGFHIPMLRKQKIAALKKEMQKRLDETIKRKEGQKARFIYPRYDEVYYEGVKWLDENG